MYVTVELRYLVRKNGKSKKISILFFKLSFNHSVTEVKSNIEDNDVKKKKRYLF